MPSVDSIQGIDSDAVGHVYRIKTSKGFHSFNDQYVLMEVTNEFLDKLLSDDPVNIVGGYKDNAVLITDCETHQIRTNETSNTMILVGSSLPRSALLSGQSVTDIVNQEANGVSVSYVELSKIKPDAQRLADVLNQYPYKGPANEKSYDVRKFLSFSQLIEKVQCSSFELIDTLHGIDALLFDGFWRLLDESYLNTCVTQISNLIDKIGLDYKNVSYKAVCDGISQLIPDIIVDHCLSLISNFESRTVPFSFRPDKIVKFIASYILYSPVKMVCDDFIYTWKAMIPKDFVADENDLKGVVFFDRENNCAEYFSKRMLSYNIDERLKQMFRFRHSWNRTDIDYYVSDVTIDVSSVEQLLQTYCSKELSHDEKLIYTVKSSQKYLFYN